MRLQVHVRNVVLCSISQDVEMGWTTFTGIRNSDKTRVYVYNI